MDIPLYFYAAFKDMDRLAPGSDKSTLKAIDYIDFTVYEKDNDYMGTRFTDWSMQDALRHLPYPNRPVPRRGVASVPVPAAAPDRWSVAGRPG